MPNMLQADTTLPSCRLLLAARCYFCLVVFLPNRRPKKQSVRYAFPPTDDCHCRGTDICSRSNLLDGHSATNRLAPPSVGSPELLQRVAAYGLERRSPGSNCEKLHEDQYRRIEKRSQTAFADAL